MLCVKQMKCDKTASSGTVTSARILFSTGRGEKLASEMLPCELHPRVPNIEMNAADAADAAELHDIRADADVNVFPKLVTVAGQLNRCSPSLSSFLECGHVKTLFNSKNNMRNVSIPFSFLHGRLVSIPKVQQIKATHAISMLINSNSTEKCIESQITSRFGGCDCCSTVGTSPRTIWELQWPRCRWFLWTPDAIAPPLHSRFSLKGKMIMYNFHLSVGIVYRFRQCCHRRRWRRSDNSLSHFE